MRGILIKSNHKANELFPFMWDPFPTPFQMMRDFMGRDMAAKASFAPEVDIVETKDGYRIAVDLPGVKEEHVDVSVLGNQLTLSGHREREETQAGEAYTKYEREHGAFCRTFTLPNGVDSEQVAAELKDGVLMVTVPKKQEAQPRKVQIKK